MLKKTKIIFSVLIAAALFVAPCAFAEDVTAAATDGKIVIGAASATITIGLSKGVEMRYLNPGADAASAQWYAVASVHSGGNQGYGTAQNLTNIMKRGYLTGSPTADVLSTLPPTEASKEEWVTLGWSPQ